MINRDHATSTNAVDVATAIAAAAIATTAVATATAATAVVAAATMCEPVMVYAISPHNPFGDDYHDSHRCVGDWTKVECPL